MSRVRIVRDEREIGFLDLPGWALDTGATPLPQFAGPDSGLALIIKQDTLDITRPTRLSWERRTEPLPPARAAVFLEGVVSPRGPASPGDYVQFRWTVRRESEIPAQPEPLPRVALELHDEGLEASLRWDSFPGPGFGEGYVRGSFRADAPEARGEGEFLADFYFKGPAYVSLFLYR
jgi:hypothetical protein